MAIVEQRYRPAKTSRRRVTRRQRLDAPDFVGVFADGAVGREAAHARDVQDRLAGPFGRATGEAVDATLRCDIVLEIGQQLFFAVCNRTRLQFSHRRQAGAVFLRASASSTRFTFGLCGSIFAAKSMIVRERP